MYISLEFMKLAGLKPLRIGGKLMNGIHLQHFDIDQDMVCSARCSSAEVGSGILDSTVSMSSNLKF